MPRSVCRPVVLALSLGALALTPALLPAQIGGIIRRTQTKVERKIDQKVDKAIDQAIQCAFDDVGCIEKAKADGQPVVMTDKDGKVMTRADGSPVSDANEARGMAEAPGTGVWRNYDFTRGDSIWVATDFSNERVGRFPASQLEFVSGSMEIVERGGRRLLEAKSTSVARLRLPATLPEQFTLEFELEIGAGHFTTTVLTGEYTGTLSRAPGDYVALYSSGGIFRQTQSLSSAQTKSLVRQMMPVRLQVDGDYAIVYVGAERVGMVPNAKFLRGNAIEFRLSGQPGRETYLSDIVVAVGLDPLYDKLMADGAVTSYGFLFDSDSDRLRPESSPELEELRKMLADHGDLKLVIEGHTDATGDNAHNQDLSERRAKSVVAFLVGNGIAANRLSAVGKGETAPIGDNATPAGRQQNRRVVLRKSA
jgi:outer membrane protein OmpA-like peptidoglycan-associated protein